MNDNSISINKIDPEILEELKKLTKARVMAMSKNVRISIGSVNFSQEEILEHVQNEDAIGQEVMELQLDFLKDLASGSLYYE